MSKTEEIMLGGYLFVDGKAYLDECIQCGQPKAEIKASQAAKEPFYCMIMGEATESGSAEPYNEYDRHKFVLYFKQHLRVLAEEQAWFEYHGGDYEY